jgi:hypothetical protein
VLLARGQLILGIDGVHRTFGDANIAVDALVGIDDQEVRSFVKAGYGTDLCAIRVLAANTAFGNHVGHVVLLL